MSDKNEWEVWEEPKDPPKVKSLTPEVSFKDIDDGLEITVNFEEFNP
jgi:hypothetical protein